MEHYSEDGNSYEDEIADLMDLRQVIYVHNLIGINLLLSTSGSFRLILLTVASVCDSFCCKMHDEIS